MRALPRSEALIKNYQTALAAAEQARIALVP